MLHTKLIHTTIDTQSPRDYSDTGTWEEGYVMPVGDKMDWILHRGKYLYLWIDDALSLGVDPATNKPNNLENNFKSNWRIRELYVYAFGDTGQHGYSGKSRSGLERHPKLKKPMLPPAWTIAMSVLIQKTDEVRYAFDRLNKDRDKEGLINLAKKHGFLKKRNDSLSGVMRLKKVLDTMLNVDVSGF